MGKSKDSMLKVLRHHPSLRRWTFWNTPESVPCLLPQSQTLLSEESVRIQGRAVQGVLMNTCMGGCELLHRTSMSLWSWKGVCVWPYMWRASRGIAILAVWVNAEAAHTGRGEPGHLSEVFVTAGLCLSTESPLQKACHCHK